MPLTLPGFGSVKANRSRIELVSIYSRRERNTLRWGDSLKVQLKTPGLSRVGNFYLPMAFPISSVPCTAEKAAARPVQTSTLHIVSQYKILRCKNHCTLGYDHRSVNMSLYVTWTNSKWCMELLCPYPDKNQCLARRHRTRLGVLHSW